MRSMEVRVAEIFEVAMFSLMLIAYSVFAGPVPWYIVLSFGVGWCGMGTINAIRAKRAAA